MGISKDKSTLFMDQHWCPLEGVFIRFRKVNSRLGVCTLLSFLRSVV